MNALKIAALLLFALVTTSFTVSAAVPPSGHASQAALATRLNQLRTYAKVHGIKILSLTIRRSSMHQIIDHGAHGSRTTIVSLSQTAGKSDRCKVSANLAASKMKITVISATCSKALKLIDLDFDTTAKPTDHKGGRH